MLTLKIAYWINILFLFPTAIPTVFRLYRTDQGCFEESTGWRVLTGGLWTGILVLSILGLFQPLVYSPLLLLLLIYKVVWLSVYVAPRLARGESAAIPWGMAVLFAAMAVAWIFIIPWDYIVGLTH